MPPIRSEKNFGVSFVTSLRTRTVRLKSAIKEMVMAKHVIGAKLEYEA